MARAKTETALSLDKYAEIMGINPAHFNNCYGQTVFPVSSNCDSIWYQYDWQNYDQVSRESLARHIAEAESEIASVLGFWPGPRWFEFDLAEYPRHHRPDVISGGVYDVRDFRMPIKLPHGKIIAVGPRTIVALDSTVTITYSDPDGDGIDELATTTASITDAYQTIITNINAGKSTSGFDLGHDLLKYGETGDANYIARWVSLYSIDDMESPAAALVPTYAPEGKIRSYRQPPYYNSGTDTLHFRMPSWSMLRMDSSGVGAYPTVDGGPSFDLANVGGSAWLSSEGEVYAVIDYPDYSSAHATLYWTSDFNCSSCNGSGCSRCAHTTQDACILVRDPELGIVTVTPATWDSDDSAWYAADYTVHRAPDRVQVRYYAGAVSEAWRQGLTHEPMDEQLARAVAYLATARLERPMCGCGNSVALAERMMRDLSLSSPDGGFIVVGEDVLNNPFGTRYGEVHAWRIVSKLTNRHFGVALM